MSDIPPPEVPVDLPPPPGEPTPDTEFLALLEKLGPTLAEVAKAAVAEAVATTPTPTFRPGAVQGVNAAERTASVLVDGDTAPITAQVLTDLPSVNDRVMLCFAPPSAVFLSGLITTSGTPAGVISPYCGPITHHANAETGATTGAPPRGWLWCAGQSVNRADYPALFEAIGTTYGSSSATTFNVPDLRGRLPIGLDNMGGSDANRIGLANTLGTTGGTNTLTTSHLPPHTHDLGNHTHDLGNHTHQHTPTGSINTSGLGTSDPGTHTHSYGPQGTSGGFGLVDSATASSSGTVSTGPAGAHTHTITGSATFTGTQTPTTGPSTNATSGPSSNSSGNGPGMTAELLPPVMAVHWIIKA